MSNILRKSKNDLVYEAMTILIDSQQFNRTELYECLDLLLGFRSVGQQLDMCRKLCWDQILEDGTRAIPQKEQTKEEALANLLVSLREAGSDCMRALDQYAQLANDLPPELVRVQCRLSEIHGIITPILA